MFENDDRLSLGIPKWASYNFFLRVDCYNNDLLAMQCVAITRAHPLLSVES